jgi:hypothetical protein
LLLFNHHVAWISNFCAQPEHLRYWISGPACL